MFDNGIDDDTFAKIVACIRIAVPYTGMILSTRESKKCRERVLHLGISQISGGSRTSVGGYVEEEAEDESSEQFDVSDKRTLDEVVNWLMDMEYIPRLLHCMLRGKAGAGDRFMSLCKSGQDSELLSAKRPNDAERISYGLCFPRHKRERGGDDRAEIQNIPKEKVRQIVREHLEEIEKGNRDFRF